MKKVGDSLKIEDIAFTLLRESKSFRFLSLKRKFSADKGAVWKGIMRAHNSIRIGFLSFYDTYVHQDDNVINQREYKIYCSGTDILSCLRKEIDGVNRFNIAYGKGLN